MLMFLASICFQKSRKLKDLRNFFRFFWQKKGIWRKKKVFADFEAFLGLFVFDFKNCYLSSKMKNALKKKKCFFFVNSTNVVNSTNRHWLVLQTDLYFCVLQCTLVIKRRQQPFIFVKSYVFLA